MHHFFISSDSKIGNQIYIKGSDVNHIRNVLRMKAGEELLISDGQGNDYLCRLTGFTDTEVISEILDEEYAGTELDAKLYLFQALPKNDKMEMIIQKAVELGVYAVVPVKTSRCVVKLDDKKAASKIKRWTGISESAAKQSRRSIIPKVENPLTFKEAIEMVKDFDMKIIPYENFKDMEETVRVLNDVEKKEKIAIFIGPEGGFAPEEIEMAMQNGIQPISLGKRILRTETAGMAILSVLMFRLENRKA